MIARAALRVADFDPCSIPSLDPIQLEAHKISQGEKKLASTEDECVRRNPDSAHSLENRSCQGPQDLQSASWMRIG